MCRRLPQPPRHRGEGGEQSPAVSRGKQQAALVVVASERKPDPATRRGRPVNVPAPRFVRSLLAGVTSQPRLYSHHVLTITSRLDVMNRLGRAMADPTRSRILMSLLEGPSYPAVLSRELELTRSNVSNHLTCLRDCGIVVTEPEGRQTRYEISDPHLARALTALVDVTLAVDENAACIDRACSVTGCCEAVR